MTALGSVDRRGGWAAGDAANRAMDVVFKAAPSAVTVEH